MVRGAKAVASVCAGCLLLMAAADAVCSEEPVPTALDADLDRVVIRQAPKGRYAMYGGLTKLPDGEILCVYKVGSLDPKTNSPWTVRDETIVWARSTGRGRNWPQQDQVIYQNRQTRQENCCGTGLRSKDGTLRHPFYILNADYEETAQPQNWSHLHLAESQDNGQHWSVRRVETPLVIAASFGGMLRLDDGTVLLGVYGSAKRGDFRHQAGALRSKDDGGTWAQYSILGASADRDGGPARLNETSITQLPDGRLISMSRTQYAGYPLYRGQSSDRGRTWAVAESGLTGLCPAVCFSRCGPPQGTLSVIYHDRWGKHAKKGGVYAAFSTDGGTTWGEPVWIDGGAYPCAIEMEPGRLFVSYYRSSSRLLGVFLSVPFPAGLRAAASPGAPGRVVLRWDAYQGSNADTITYRVYRSAREDSTLDAASAIGTVDKAASWTDSSPLRGKSCYRVAAFQGERRLGQSWLAKVELDDGKP